MRELIRPTLFIVARLGLFLAVGAWIVGQWWQNGVATVVPMPVRLIVATYRPGLVLARPAESQTWQWTDAPVDAWRGDWQEIWFTVDNEFAMARNSDEILPTVFQHKWGKTNVLSVRHWLIVAIFIAFNIALHFIYSKCSEAQPCED